MVETACFFVLSSFLLSRELDQKTKQAENVKLTTLILTTYLTLFFIILAQGGNTLLEQYYHTDVCTYQSVSFHLS